MNYNYRCIEIRHFLTGDSSGSMTSVLVIKRTLTETVDVNFRSMTTKDSGTSMTVMMILSARTTGSTVPDPLSASSGLVFSGDSSSNSGLSSGNSD